MASPNKDAQPDLPPDEYVDEVAGALVVEEGNTLVHDAVQRQQPGHFAFVSVILVVLSWLYFVRAAATVGG